MSSKPLLKSVSKLIISEMERRGVTLKPTLSHQLIAAAFGLWSNESLKAYDLPFEEVNPLVFQSAKPQFHTKLLCERLESLLGLDSAKALDFAMLIQDLLTHHIPIRVQTLRVLFDEQYAQSRAMIFKLLKPKNSQNPTIASVAIANGYLPALPASSLEASLTLMRSKTVGDKKSRCTVEEFVTQAPTWIWCYPSELISETFHSLVDSAFHVTSEADNWVFPKPAFETEVGVGFVLIQSRSREPMQAGFNANCFTVVSGSFFLEAKGAAVQWSDVKVHSRDREDRRRPGQKTFNEVLGLNVEELPLLSICATCDRFRASTAQDDNVITCDCRSH